MNDPTQEEIDARKAAGEKPFEDLEEQVYNDYETLKEMARKEVLEELLTQPANQHDNLVREDEKKNNMKSWEVMNAVNHENYLKEIQSMKDKIKEIIRQNRDNWALSLTYMADEKLDNQFETAKGHLDLIFDGLISYIEKI